ncbi:tyrosinase [Teratosphaeria nubilosa]|uniref:Tyrosinase n=1 Tax=Teratosphaeria nubilosa TaxID=161662 RepID=A0A6G1LGU8_9PEZI|nr:tyrosinase [Teratosphaeria nubilosa]
MQNNINSRSDATCTYENAQVRKEWRSLDEATRKSFTDAVTCLYGLPPRYMTSDQASSYPGVKNRYDEYVATHINYTLNIHDTADFLAWHRRFASLWEQDLKNSCGYTGVLPYWNWAIDAQAPQDSPLFSGDEYSIGSNGEYISGRSSTYLASQDVTYPAGTGGGCVYSGPFTNYTVNLGPLDLPNYNNVNSSFEYNPHCLQRDINPWFTQNYNTYTNLTQTILDYIYIETFQDYMQGYGENNPFGIHGGGHWQGGGNMMDFHSSPADPLFFLHHAMIDNVWTTWQNLDITRRQNVIYGTSTLGNSPPSADMSLDDSLPFGFVTDEQQVFGDLMDTFSGPFCYRYDITP